MNKQELIDILKRQLEAMPGASGGPYDGGYEYATKHHLAMIADLDEPEKPVVPKLVADMIVERKKAKYGIVGTIRNLDVFKEPFKWIIENQEEFAKAWLYGYEVEKEKLYTVEIQNPNSDEYLFLSKNINGKVYASLMYSEYWRGDESTLLTEAEIKQDFEWAFRWAKEVEE